MKTKIFLTILLIVFLFGITGCQESEVSWFVPYAEDRIPTGGPHQETRSEVGVNVFQVSF